MTNIQSFAAPAGRVLIAIMFVMAGFSKISGYEGTVGYMQSVGIPGFLLPLVIGLEVGGGLAVILGWQTRVAAFGLAGFCVLTAVFFHADFANQMQTTMFMKNFAMAGGFLFLVAHGAGAYSLDNRFAKAA